MRKTVSIILVALLAFLHTQSKAQIFGGCSYDLQVSESVCYGDNFTFPDGFVRANIISQVTHTSNLLTVVNACDSIITTTIDPYPYNFRSETIVNICGGDVYTFPDGTVMTIEFHTEHTSILQAVNTGCDSIIETILNTTDIDNSVSVSGHMITANQQNAGLQWVDCNNGYSYINGQSGQSYIAPQGSFAVIIFKGSCIDTSACQQIMTVGIDNLQDKDHNVTLFPNPTNGVLKVNLGETYDQLAVILRNVMGQQLYLKSYENVSMIDMNLFEVGGIYFLELRSESGLNATYKILKQ